MRQWPGRCQLQLGGRTPQWAKYQLLEQDIRNSRAEIPGHSLSSSKSDELVLARWIIAGIDQGFRRLQRRTFLVFRMDYICKLG